MASDTSVIQKPRLAAYLVAHADRRGWVDRTTNEMQGDLGVPEHDIVHALHDFQRQGWLHSRAHTKGTVTEMTAIRVTSPGRQKLIALAAEAEPKGVVAIIRPAEVAADESAQALEPDAGYVALEAAYPIAAGLQNRQKLLETAAALLDTAGAEELALQTLERAHDPGLFTALEREAIAMYERLASYGVDLGA